MFFDIIENNKIQGKSLIINSRRTLSEILLLGFDDFFACFKTQKPLYLHHQGRFLNGLQSHLYGIEIAVDKNSVEKIEGLQSHLYGIEISKSKPARKTAEQLQSHLYGIEINKCFARVSFLN